MPTRTQSLILVFLLVHSAVLCHAQTSPAASPAKTPETQTVQESVRTLIEEVRIPVTAGTVGLPASADEMIDQAVDVARNVDSQYIVSYKPLRSLGSAAANEYRRIDIFSRRVGLNVRARRGYVANVQK